MKTFAIVLLCALAAVQARSGVVQNTRSLAALGENPWVVHLRLAVSTSGLLNSCAGAIIDNRWVLTTANCLRDQRFIWVRYGVVTVPNPGLVTENSIVRTDPTGTLALININRFVHSTDNIAQVPLAKAEVNEIPSSAKFCGFGSDETGGPGEELACFDVAVEVQEDGTLDGTSEDGETTQYDIGAPLVADGVLVGVLLREGDAENAAKIVPVADYLDWIASETGLPVGSQPDESIVKVVN